MLFRIQVFQVTGFSGSRFFKVHVQVLEVALKLIVALNFSLLHHDIYVYNFSSLSINLKNICTKLDSCLKVFIYVMILFSEKFLNARIHWNISFRLFHETQFSVYFITFNMISWNSYKICKKETSTIKKKWIQKRIKCSICYWYSTYFLKNLQSKKQKEKGVSFLIKLQASGCTN